VVFKTGVFVCLVIVVVIAVAVKYGGFLQSDRQGSPGATPVPSLQTLAVTPAPVTTETTTSATAETTVPATTVPTPAPTPLEPVPYQIYYTDKPFDYPVFTLPDHMETFGASEIPWKDPDVVTFAYIDEPRGGLTHEFSVPYGLWRMNITVDAHTKPQYARFDMVLCYAKDGRIIDGMEILYPGSAFRAIQISNTDMYVIVHTDNVDRFRINFETPRAYYNQVAGTT
jgi:hypothetical protein